MIETVFIQKENGEFITPCAFDAWRLFDWMGYTTSFFESRDLKSLPLTKNTLVVGWVKTALDALKILGVEKPKPLDYPMELQEFLGRKIWNSNMGWIRENLHSRMIGETSGKVFFIKPVAHKEFSPFLTTNLDSLLFYGSVSNEEPVWVSEQLEFDSEYRCFVKNNKVVAMKHYLGDFRSFPDFSTIDEMVASYAPAAPIAYSLDVGVAQGKKTCLIEVNDAFALGNYGWYSTKYAEMLESRWLEIVNK